MMLPDLSLWLNFIASVNQEQFALFAPDAVFLIIFSN